MKLQVTSFQVLRAIEAKKEIELISCCCPVYQCCIENGIPVKSVGDFYVNLWENKQAKLDFAAQRITHKFSSEWNSLLIECPIDIDIEMPVELPQPTVTQ